MSIAVKFHDAKAALNAGMAVGMWRVSYDDIIWRLPGQVEKGASFTGIATERTCPHECCGWFFIASPEDVKTHQIAEV